MPSTDDTKEVVLQGTLCMALGLTDGTDAQQLHHGPLLVPPSCYPGRFHLAGSLDTSARDEFLRGRRVESIQDDVCRADARDVQGWTYVADFTLDPASLHVSATQFYIHARINAVGQLQFAAFTERIDTPVSSTLPVGRVLEGADVEQFVHGCDVPPLRIAGKAEAEAFLLPGGRLRLSASPQCLGSMMAMGNIGIIINGTRRVSKAYGGHIWVYWGSIIDRVLYIVGICAYQGSGGGHVRLLVNGQHIDKELSCPPTVDDVKHNTHPAFRAACSLVWGEGADSTPVFNGTCYNVAAMLDAWGDPVAPCVLCQRQLASVKQEGVEGYFRLAQLNCGDIDAGASLMNDAGVSYADGSRHIYRDGDLVHTYELPASMPLHGGRTSFGAYAPCPKSHLAGHFYADGCAYPVYSALYWSVYQVGQHYRIETAGHNARFRCAPEGEHMDFPDEAVTVPGTVDEDDGSGANDDDDPFLPLPSGGDEEEDEPDGSIEEIEGGYWYVNSGGMQLSHRTNRNQRGPTITWRIGVAEHMTRTVEIPYCEVQAGFTINDGGDFVGPYSTHNHMYYALSEGASALIAHNQTQYRWNGSDWEATHPPASDSVFRAYTTVTAYLKAEWDDVELPHTVLLSGGNIVSVRLTGRIKHYLCTVAYQTQHGLRHKLVRLKLQIVELELNTAVCEAIMDTWAASHAANAAAGATITPGAVTGSCSGTPAAPCVTSGGIALVPPSASNAGHGPATGDIYMFISGQWECGDVSYALSNDFTGWEEAGGRHTASLGPASFDVTFPATLIETQRV